MRLHKLMGGILLAGWLAAYPMGGNSQHPLQPLPNAGEIFVHVSGGTSYVTQSNTVQVDTLSIDSITTNVNEIVLGQLGMIVTMSVRNTSATRDIQLNEITLHFYNRRFTSIPSGQTPLNYLVDQAFTKLLLNPQTSIPANTTVDFVFRVDVTGDPLLFPKSLIVIDGFLRYASTYYDNYWTQPDLYSGIYQYAAREIAEWDASGEPEVFDIFVVPDPAKAGIITVNVIFSEDMNTAIPPNVGFVVNGLPRTFTGAWSAADTWTGIFNIPDDGLHMYDGIASLNVTGAQDAKCFNMLPHPDIYNFVIDTIPPTLSLWPATQTANVGMALPVTLVANEPLGVTPQAELLISGNITSPLVIISNMDRTTWNAYVQIPVSAIPAIGTVATFNLPIGFEYADLAGNTNNYLGGLLTINIEETVPVIVTVNFDTMPAQDGLVISSEPFISVYILDYKQIRIDPASVRITVDGVLVYSGPASIFRIAEIAEGWVYQFDWQYPNALSVGTHIFEIGLKDMSGIAAVPYIVRVNVRTRSTALVRPPVPVPNPFSPNDDGLNDTTEIVYQLTNPTDVNIYIYDINGNVVWRRYIPRGDEGAHAGLNRVVWDGKASFNNQQVLPNGLYICHILVDKAGEKKSLGRTKIMILN